MFSRFGPLNSLRMAAGTLLLLLPAGARCSPIAFSPASGQPGNVVTITGAGFTGATLVEFNTNTPTLGDFTVVSSTELLAVVPAGAQSGAMAVIEGGTSLYSASNFLVAPFITSFSPSTGASPTVVYIFGANFVSKGTTVFFSGVTNGVTASNVGLTEIAAQVPVGAGDGPITVVTSAGSCVSTTNFLAGSKPTITSISPNFATNGQQNVEIFGGNFFSPVTVVFGTTQASQATIVSTTQLTVTVPTGANGSNVTVTTSFGSATYSNFLTGSGAVITSFTPTASPLNNYVWLYGLGMTAVTNVKFNGHVEQLLSTGSTSVEVYLTNSAGIGPITVTAGGVSFTTTTNFTNASIPLITGFTPALGAAGSTVSINGLNFTGTPTVKFGATSATAVVTEQGAELSATVPSIATGNYAITVTASDGAATSTNDFIVTGSAPVITGFSPTNGVRGTSVTLTGANFSGASAVTFNGVTATFQTPTSTTELIATVPANATSGDITVSNPGGSGSSPASFYMQPWITSLSTNGQIVNSSVTLTGRSLSGATLQINGLVYSNDTVTATNIVATIPSNATSGQIEIANSGGTFITTNVFAILPKIYSFTPGIGPAGTVVTISGTSLFDVTGVKFGGVAATAFTATTNQIQVTVPANAASGPLTVVTPYGNDISTNSFTATTPSFVLLTKTANPIVTALGSNMTYVLQVTNQGPSTITATVVTDTLPSGFSFASANTASGTWLHTNGAVVWNIGILTNGNAVSLNLTGTSASAVAFTNYAVLAFAEGNLLPANNIASAVNYFVSGAQRTLSIASRNQPPGVTITWPQSPANFLLQINTSSNLYTGWTYPTNAIFLTNSLNTFTDTLTAPWTFFRLAPP